MKFSVNDGSSVNWLRRRREIIIMLFIVFVIMPSFGLFAKWQWSSLFSRASSSTSCLLSSTESYGFICEPDLLWIERKRVYHNQDKKNMHRSSDPAIFRSNWEPNFHCTYAERIGRMGEGGKWICDLARLKARHNCLVYRAGSRGEFSFEFELKQAMPHCEIHTFDMDKYLCSNNICSFHHIVLGDGNVPRGSKSWLMVLKGLQHSHRVVDILKIDIDGGEYIFLANMFKQNVTRNFPRQILVEIHKTSSNIIHKLFELLRSHGYAIFQKEPTLVGSFNYCEYGFIKLDPNFFL